MMRRCVLGVLACLVLPASLAIAANGQAVPTLTITAPVANTVAQAGDAISVTIAATDPQLLNDVTLLSSLPVSVIPVQSIGSSMAVSVTLPSNLPSAVYSFTAVGRTAGGVDIESATVDILVAPGQAPQGLAVSQTMVLEHPGARLPLDVRASVGGRMRAIDASLLSFTSNAPAVATVTSEGTVTGQAPGVAQIAIRYGGLSSTVQVTVGGSIAGDLDGDGRISSTDRSRVSEAVGHPANGANDARDLNRDGIIDSADVALLEAMCTETCVPRDGIAPVITCGMSDGLWHAANISIACSAQDYELGLARSLDLSFDLPTSVATGVETSDAGTDSRQVCDVAGNCAAAGPVRGNRVDRLAPSLTLPAPQTVLQTQPSGAVVSYPAATAADGGSGVASTTCAPASGTVFPLGTTDVLCTTVDAVGNSRSGNFTVTVAAAPPATADGRMFGKGHVLDGTKRHHHFLLRAAERRAREYARFEYWTNASAGCADDREDGRLGRDDDEYGKGRRGVAFFEAVTIDSVEFGDDPAFRAGGKKAPDVDSVVIKGSGKWNGRTGYRFEVNATDRGEPGRNRDTASVVIRDAANVVVASVNATLSGGNIQSLRLKK